MSLIRSALSSLCVLSLAPSALATVGFSLKVDNVNDAAGVDVSTATGSWILVADTTQNGFQPITSGSIGVNDFVSGDDLVIARGDFTTFATAGVISAAPSGLSFGNGWGEGDPLALVWFPEGGVGRGTASSGDAYGLYTSDVGQDSADPWITPADGASSHALRLVTEDNNFFFGAPAAPVDSASVRANLSVVPEPSVSLLGLVSAFFLIRRRR